MTHPKPVVLVPIDFSDCAQDVIDAALSVAAPKGARVALLHVIDSPDGVSLEDRVRRSSDSASYSYDVAAKEHLEREAKTLMAAHADQVRRAGADVDTYIAYGTPQDVIVAQATEIGADRIVMGTHGRRGISRLVLGSVADAVGRRSPVPVITIPTVHRVGCDARSCAWCATHVTPAQAQLRAEADG
jgi:nucleotide-binding universal stress UspA family protein